MRSKLVLSSVLFLILPVLITVAVSSYVTKDVIKEQAVMNATKRLEMIDSHISNLLNSMIYTANYVQFDSEINILLRNQKYEMQNSRQTDPEFNALDYKKITAKLENISISRDEMYISILVSENLYFSNYSFYDYKPAQFYHEPWFQSVQQLPEGSTNWFGANPNYIQSKRKESPYMMTLVRVVKGLSSQPFGYIVVSINENQFKSIMNNRETDERIMLINSQEVVLSYQNNEKMAASAAYIDRIVSGKNADIVEMDGTKYLLVKRSLTSLGWQLLILTPYKEAVSKINVIYGSNLIIQIALFSAFLLILVYLVIQFTKPVIKRGNVALAVERGKMESRSNIRGNDEVGRLGYLFDKMLDRVQEMIKQIRTEQAKKREVELKMLQAQVNPHFLFNLLNSIRLRIMLMGDEENASLISSLSLLLRMTISRNNEFIPLREEFNIVVQYVKLMNVRREESIDIDVRLPPDCMFDEVPRFLIQPLVENVFNHGIRQGKGKIVLIARKSDDDLMISVEDNGAGMSEELLHHLRNQLVADSDRRLERTEAHQESERFSGIGIQNIYERMELIYGGRFQMTIDSQLGAGSKFSLYIPISK